MKNVAALELNPQKPHWPAHLKTVAGEHPAVPPVATWHTAEVDARVRRAQRLIEAAQNNLRSAQQELSSIRGALAVWKKTGAFADRLHAFWYEVRDKRRATWSIDREPTAEELAALADSANAVLR